MAPDKGFGLSYIPTVSRPDTDPAFTDLVSRGRANDLVRLYFGEEMSGRVEPKFAGELLEDLQNRLTSANAAVYLCGNPDMIADAKPILAANGYETEGREAQVITEDYW